MMNNIMFFLVVGNHIDFSKFAIDVSDVYKWAGIILAAIGSIWGIKKMIQMAYYSSGISKRWQERYDKEMDDMEYEKFRDSGGFEGKEFIGSVGDKSWYYDKDGDVSSVRDLFWEREDSKEDEEDLNIGWDK